VRETEFTLESAKIILNRLDVYVFKAENAGNATHALAIRMAGAEATTGAARQLEPGKSAELKAPLKEGTYKPFVLRTATKGSV
jgi:hypothetical protein